MTEIKPEQLHQWYLEACKMIDPSSFNPKAQKPYKELTEAQKSIDRYICNKINTRPLVKEGQVGNVCTCGRDKPCPVCTPPASAEWPHRIDYMEQLTDGTDGDYMYGWNACHDAFMKVIQSQQRLERELAEKYAIEIWEECATTDSIASYLQKTFGQPKPPSLPSLEEIANVIENLTLRSSVYGVISQSTSLQIAEAIHQLMKETRE